MRCEQITPYLPGFSGGDLRPDTTSLVAEHVSDCGRCRSELGRLERTRTALATLAVREVEPPAFLLDAVLESVGDRKPRLVPFVLPTVPADVIRVLQENKDTIAQAGATALVAAGAAYALWRAVRGRRSAQPATS